jgi:hypothetical protein
MMAEAPIFYQAFFAKAANQFRFRRQDCFFIYCEERDLAAPIAHAAYNQLLVAEDD